MAAWRIILHCTKCNRFFHSIHHLEDHRKNTSVGCVDCVQPIKVILPEGNQAEMNGENYTVTIERMPDRETESYHGFLGYGYKHDIPALIDKGMIQPCLT